MLLVPSWLLQSEIHGLGCFAASSFPEGFLVWAYNIEVDREIDGENEWERQHAYGSNARPGKIILPGDNAMWINFSDNPTLIEAEEINGEFCLRASEPINPCQELTVSRDSDADAGWKLADSQILLPSTL